MFAYIKKRHNLVLLPILLVNRPLGNEWLKARLNGFNICFKIRSTFVERMLVKCCRKPFKRALKEVSVDL